MILAGTLSPCVALEVAFAKQMFDQQLMENYGHAGDIYGQWLVNNLEEAKSGLLKIQSVIDAKLRLTQRERFWSAVVAANITGAKIAKDRLGLLDWDLRPVYEFACDLINNLRKEVAPPVTNHMATIGGFMNRHINNTLIVNDAVDRRTNMPMLPNQEPKGELFVRYEPDTQLYFIEAKRFKSDCAERQVSYKETINMLRGKGILIDIKNKRLTKGMKLTTPGVPSIILNAAHPEFANLVNNVVSAATANENSGG